ncbi:hypothetical protein BASA50_003367 [Batrachochytrium salamandrivorans]|uniref:Uncharacterized protein n=1 Tax=Batrachochytrium salamandrivorans TaxID=1357716 RepID=A0ABQ8FLE9_9FUNG|nr:hypothetical protein BASA50_003367 [Batrachochytrium salamandrivorans]
MKLQGVFMIMPLLAAAASGSTIPSTDSYNVQQLEKRGNNDPDINEPADEESNGQEESSDGSRLGAAFQGFFDQDKTNGPVEPSKFLQLGQRIRDFFTKDGDDGDDEDDDFKNGLWVPKNIVSGEGEEKPEELSSSSEETHTPQDTLSEDEDEKPDEPSKFLQLGQRLRGIFNKNKSKTNGQGEPHSSSEDLFVSQDIVAVEKEEKPDELDNALKENREKQDKLAEDMSRAMERLKQRRLEKKNGKPSEEASNKKLPETQVQEVVQPSDVSQESIVDTSPALNSPESSHDHSHDSQAEPEQTKDDDQRASDDIKQKYQLRSSKRF